MGLLEILVGDARERLRDVDAGSVQTVVSSPPYFGLRDYGHAGQIGLEQSPAQFVTALVEVFGEVRRVLRDDGTLWLNLGDSYAASGAKQTGRNDQGGVCSTSRLSPKGDGLPNNARISGAVVRLDYGAKPKDLLGIPWMVAFALRADGWFLRSANIWSKPNPMPESVRDRPTSSYEMVFLLSKRGAYFYDAEAIAEEAESFGRQHTSGEFSPKTRALKESGHHGKGGDLGINYERERRNARNVWTIATQPCGDQLCQRCGRYYRGAEMARLPKARPPHRPDPVCRCGASDGWLAHYATMPPALAERCILAGTSAVGGCGECGAPWRRVVEKRRLRDGKPLVGCWAKPEDARRLGATGVGHWRDETRVSTTGWEPSCSCSTGLDPVPQRVLDPFGGAGTTALVARRLQRAVTLVELHPGYARLAQERVAADAPLLEATA